MKRKVVLIIPLLLVLTLGLVVIPAAATTTKIFGKTLRGWVYPIPTMWESWYKAHGSIRATYTLDPDTADILIFFCIPEFKYTVTVKLVELTVIATMDGSIWIGGYWDVYVNGKLSMHNIEGYTQLYFEPLWTWIMYSENKVKAWGPIIKYGSW